LRALMFPAAVLAVRQAARAEDETIGFNVDPGRPSSRQPWLPLRRPKTQPPAMSSNSLLGPRRFPCIGMGFEVGGAGCTPACRSAFRQTRPAKVAHQEGQNIIAVSRSAGV
jgi:hypothetical protein